MAQGATRFICSSLLAQAFVLIGYQIVPVQIDVRDAWTADHRYVTSRDFASAPPFEVVSSTRVSISYVQWGSRTGRSLARRGLPACGRRNSLVSSDTGTRTR